MDLGSPFENWEVDSTLKFTILDYLIWIFVNVPPYPYGLGDFWGALATATTGRVGIFRGMPNIVFPYTYATAILSFLIALYIFWRRRKLPFSQSFLFAGTFPFAQTSSFEIMYNYNGVLATPTKFAFSQATLLVISIGWFSWLLLGISTIGYWRWSRLSTVMVACIAVFWTAWDLVGFPQYFEGSSFGAVVNIALKLLYAGFFISLLIAIRNH